MQRALVILLIAAVLLAVVVCVPMALLPLAAFVLVAVALRRAAAVSDEQPLALAALVAFRAPPA